MPGRRKKKKKGTKGEVFPKGGSLNYRKILGRRKA